MNEANLLTVSFGAALALTLGVGAVLYYRQREWPLEARLLLALCPTLALVAGVNVLGRILFAPFEASMNNVHLAPTFGLRYGYHLYYPPGEGPIFNPMYPPVNYLFYLPATVTGHPTVAVVLGSLLSAAVCLLPIGWMHVRRRANDIPAPCSMVAGVVGLSCFVLFTVVCTPLIFSVFRTRPDAPALGLAMAACAVLFGRSAPLSRHAMILSALFVGLSIWTKQTMVLVAPALLGYIVLRDGWREAGRYLLSMTITVGLLSLVLIVAFWPPEVLWYNFMTVPGRHVLRGGGMRMWVDNWREFGGYAWFVWLLLPAVTALAIREFWGRRQEPGQRASLCAQFLRTQPWTLPACVGVLMIPMAMLQRAKDGGVENAHSLAIFFLLAAGTLGLRQLLAQELRGVAEAGAAVARSGTWLALLAVVVVLPLALPEGVFLLRDDTALGTDDNAVAYRFCLTHPGQIYFPEHPLPMLLAEGHLYSTRDGVSSLETARLPPDRAWVLRTLPKDLHFIAIPSRFKYVPDIIAAGYLPQYSRKITLPELPGWDVWVEP